jgi:RNA polymerase sigma-70 factor (ECF subfamily)
MLFQAHRGAPDAIADAQREILQRYSTAIRRYLLAAVSDANTADDLFQDFALRFVRGDFKQADPVRGRFRDYLKRSLYNLVVDHQRRQRGQPLPLPGDIADSSVGCVIVPEAAEQAFLADWRADLMGRAWAALERWEVRTGQPLHTVLRLRAANPDLDAAKMADRLAPRVGKHVTSGWVRKRLHFARARFTDLLLEEVAQTLAAPTREELEQELVELGLLGYCRDALERRHAGSSPVG